MQSDYQSKSWLDRAVFKAFPQLTVETLLVVLILVFSVTSRVSDLGARVMSHDETNHVVPSYDLFQGRGYAYSPVTHGPLQFHLIALSYFVFGDSDFSSRIPAAACGVLTVAFALFGFRRHLGRVGALIAGFLFTISPNMLFYSRYARDEAIYILFTAIMIWAILRYLESGEKKFLYCLTTAMALNFVTMESAYIYTAQALLFVGLLFLEQITRRQWRTSKLRSDFITAIGAAILLALAGLAGWMTGASAPAAVVEAEPATTAAAASSIFSSLTTEATILVVAASLAAVAFGIAAIFFLVKGVGLACIRRERSFDLLFVMGFLVLPLLSAFPIKAAGFDPLDYSSAGIVHSALFLVPMAAIAVFLGWWWSPRLFLRNATIFYGIFIFFYTTCFTNGAGFFEGLVGALGYWLSQQGVNRGTQPWYYYWLLQIPFYEFLPAAGALLACYFGIRRKLWVSAPGEPFENALPQPAYDPFSMPDVGQNPEENPAGQPVTIMTEERPTSGEPGGSSQEDGSQLSNPDSRSPILLPVPVLALLLFWGLTSVIAFSIAGEKMPWLTVNPGLALILSSAWGLGYLVESTRWQKLLANRPLLILGLFVMVLASLAGVLGSLLGSQPPFLGTDLIQLQSTSTFLLSAAVLVVSGYFLLKLAANWKWFEISRALMLTLFAFLAVVTIRTSFRASFINYNNAMEFLVYAHGASGSKDILKQVGEISFRTTGAKDIAVAYDNEALYPFWWYFRDYPNKFYFTTPTNKLKDSPVVIAWSGNYAKVEAILGDAYYNFEYTRLWWPVEIYKNLTWNRIAAALDDPQMRTAVWDIWFNRDYSLYAQLTNRSDLTVANWWNPARFRIYIRKDIIVQIWQYGVPAAALPTVTDPYAQGQINLPANFAIGSPGSEPGLFDGPRQIAFAPDGSLYVADSRNNRIQHLNQDGSVIQVWGSYADVANGSAPGGTFNELWGVAIGPDGSVYVADTFNYRIQKFTAAGQFLTMWGQSGTGDTPDAFWGPRGLAVDSEGKVFVTDTGNKRVVVFDKDGNYITQFGGAGTDPGQFDEPVGIAIDGQGKVYVADTWNQRIQVFALDPTTGAYTPVNEWNISGWAGQSLDNKPFIAVDSQDNVFVTDPEVARVLEFDSKGSFIHTWGQPGASPDGIGLASGIAVDPDGYIWVSDSENDQLLSYTLPSP